MGYKAPQPINSPTKALIQLTEQHQHNIARSWLKFWATCYGVKIDSVEHVEGTFYDVWVDGEHYQITFEKDAEHFADFGGIAWCTDGLVDVDGQLVPRFMTVEGESGNPVRLL